MAYAESSWTRGLILWVMGLTIHSTHGGLPEVQGGPANYLLLQSILILPVPPACSSATVEKAKTRERQKRHTSAHLQRPYSC